MLKTNRKYKWAAATVAISMLTLGLSACSSNETGKTATTSTAAPTATPAPVQSSGPDFSKKLTISSIHGTWTAPILPPDGAGVTGLNERYNIDFKYQAIPYDEYVNKLPVVMAGGDLPDMIGIETVDSNFIKWSKQGAFLPLNDYLAQYPTLAAIPQSVWDAVTINGNIYAIPHYFPKKYGKRPIIRKDWLDNLGLSMPTNYDELTKVAIAFAKDDPDRNGQNDTYGVGMVNSTSGTITYGVPMGAAWEGGWYHKNDAGQYIPGLISPGFKKQIEVLRDMQAGGALNKDWPVSKLGDIRTDFFSGKYGIFFEQPYDITSKRFTDLKKIHPNAEIAVIPPFEQEDGQSGVLGLSGFYEMYAINADLMKDEAKVERILQMLNDMMAFIPLNERTPDNEFFNWKKGGVNVGYEIVNGVPIDIFENKHMQPEHYIASRGWAPTDEANEPEKLMQEPFTQSFIQNAVETLRNVKVYINPINRVHSEVFNAKQSELQKAVNVHHVKMIFGQEPIENWDAMVQEYLSSGGQDVIDDVNKLMKEAGVAGEWE